MVFKVKFCTENGLHNADFLCTLLAAGPNFNTLNRESAMLKKRRVITHSPFSPFWLSFRRLLLP
jgi:hypothetical protein